MGHKEPAQKEPTREEDLQQARVIVGEYGLLIGPAGKTSETVAQAVADGIALGRKQAIDMTTAGAARRKRS